MCNLSQGIEDNGIAIGRAEGQAKIRQIILNMYEKGFTAEQITAVTEEKTEDVESIIAGKQSFLLNAFGTMIQKKKQ